MLSLVYQRNGDISGNDSFNSLFVNKDISASHWYIREDGDISGNDASFNSLFVNKDISAIHWYIRKMVILVVMMLVLIVCL